jgi:hypothetical protein
VAFSYHRHLKSSSPQVAVPDNEMKAGIFTGEAIIVEGGKQSSLLQRLYMTNKKILLLLKFVLS